MASSREIIVSVDWMYGIFWIVFRRISIRWSLSKQ